MKIQDFVKQNKEKLIEMKVSECGPDSFVFLNTAGELTIGSKSQYNQKMQIAFGGYAPNEGVASQQLTHVVDLAIREGEGNLELKIKNDQ